MDSNFLILTLTIFPTGDLMADRSIYNTVNVNFGKEGNSNDLIKNHEHRRSIPDGDNEIFIAPQLVPENLFKSDLMAVSSAVATVRNKRSKGSKHSSKKTPKKKETKRNTIGKNTKQELSDILGEIRNARHHRLTRHDIRELAKRAFAHFKKRKGTGGEKKQSIAKTGTAKKSSALTPVKNVTAEIKKEQPKEVKKSEVTKPVKDEAKEDISTMLKTKTKADAETELDNIFGDTQTETKKSDFAEDISKNLKKKPAASLFSDEAMGSAVDTKKSTHPDASKDKKANKPTEKSAVKSVTTHPDAGKDKKANKPTEKSAVKSVTKSEIDKNKESKSTKGKENQKSPEISKKSDVPAANKLEKIKTLKKLLDKANPNKVPKKFLPEFPAGLKMIAWRDLLEKKKKELAELKSSVDQTSIGKELTKSEGIDLGQGDHPVTINIEINKDDLKGQDSKTRVTHQSKDSIKTVPTKTSSDSKSKHIKYLQKHLAGAQSLRKLIARALIGHCQATGKRILQAFVAMDKALARAQTIATIIGKKFHVDSERIESLVGGKEDEVVETFLRDIFSKFN